LFILFALAASTTIAQDAVYSQYYSNPMRVNPAFAGRSYGPTFVAQYRNQWPSISANYQTYSLSYDQHLGSGNDAIGIQASRDAAGGFFFTNSITATYSYRLDIKEGYNVKIGLETGILNTALDWDQFVFEDQIDPQFGIAPGGAALPSGELRPDQLSNTSLDVSAGVLLNAKNYFLGLSAKHLTGNPTTVTDSESVNSIGIPTRFGVIAGAELTLIEGNKRKFPTLLQPTAVFVSQASFWQLNAGANVDIGLAYGGLHYRHTATNGDAVIATFGFRKDRYRFGYSFDYTISQLGIQTGGSHEISILMNLDDLYDRPSKYNDCLKLFR
jgi:type IX secretion system PorP/SprF family membrane protein